MACFLRPIRPRSSVSCASGRRCKSLRQTRTSSSRAGRGGINRHLEMLFTRMSPLRVLTAGQTNFYKEAGRALMRITVVAAAISLSIVSLSIAADAQAAMTRMRTNIPAQELGPALRSLAKERNFQIVYASKDVSALRTQGAVGEYTADEALTQILS